MASRPLSAFLLFLTADILSIVLYALLLGYSLLIRLVRQNFPTH